MERGKERPGTLDTKDQWQGGGGNGGVGGNFNCVAPGVQREGGAGQERSIGARCIALWAQGQTFLGDAFFRERLQGGRRFERLTLVRVDADAPQVYRVGERGNQGE